MENDPTLSQDDAQRLRAKQRSLQSVRPPAQVPGYELEQLLGSGAFGEVWVAVQKNTGRKVAIKFYAHRGGLDWSFLAREVEKLTFLFADRHVVQLIGVGWDATPPYYVMEFLERGSLADRLQTNRLSITQAVELFREVAVGLIHAHGKGVVHCDLKPSNVLLDQDLKPRLADFGQSRLSTEQAPALGTLFFMPPEQAALDAAPDVRWDVYALGALLYAMLTGSPPHRNSETTARLEGISDFSQRLSEYRSLIKRSPPPTEHRQMPGVDRALADVVDRCLAPDPKKRFANVQAVIDALDARDAQRARRPAMLLGTFGPALVLLVVSLFAWSGFSTTVRRSEQELLTQALKSNRFAAQSVAKAVEAGIDRRSRAVERLAAAETLRQAFAAAVGNSELDALSRQLADPDTPTDDLEELRRQYRAHPARIALQEALVDAASTEDNDSENVNSWFLNDARGVQLARVPERAKASTVGRCYAWRSYFHGGPADLPSHQRPEADLHITQTGPSAAYRSEATDIWNVAVSTPILSDSAFLGICGITIGIGRLVEPIQADARSQFAVLVERPRPDIPGHILEHPVMEGLENGNRHFSSPDNPLLIQHRDFPSTITRKTDYRDPVGNVDPQYDKRWLAETADVLFLSRGTDWVVIVQESHEAAIGATLRDLRSGLIAYLWRALAMVTVVVLGLWGVAYRLLEHPAASRTQTLAVSDTETPSTLPRKP